MINVYEGSVRTLADVPGGVRPGDVVVVDNYAGTREIGAVVGPQDRLLNHGRVDIDFSRGAAVRVYRPIT